MNVKQLFEYQALKTINFLDYLETMKNNQVFE